MARLGLKALASGLEPGVKVPEYDPSALKPGILHLGPGQFAKAHLLAYTDTVLNQQPDHWRVTGVSLHSTQMAQKLAPQDFLYSVIAESVESSEARIIGALADIISVANDAIGPVLDCLVDPDIRIVSLTITEKGYCLDGGRLDLEHSAIKADLKSPESPATAIGLIALGIELRRQKGIRPFTVMSLDNLRGNGRVLRQLVMDYCAELDPERAAFVAGNVSFPSSMVDRIVPALDDEGLALARKTLGLDDASPVITERFSQWVLEDNFPAGRPAWETAGVTLCDDIELFESMKLKLLNGAHSAMAYLGVLMDLTFVSDCMAEKELRSYIYALLTKEVLPEVTRPPGFDLHVYIESLMSRFENPHLRHRCRQIAMDGSQKIPQRLLPVIESRVESDRSIELLTIAVAGWCVFLSKDKNIEDPHAEKLRALATGKSAAGLVGNLIHKSGVFSRKLQNSRFKLKLTAVVAEMISDGPHAVLSKASRTNNGAGSLED